MPKCRGCFRSLSIQVVNDKGSFIIHDVGWQAGIRVGPLPKRQYQAQDQGATGVPSAGARRVAASALFSSVIWTAKDSGRVAAMTCTPTPSMLVVQPPPISAPRHTAIAFCSASERMTRSLGRSSPHSTILRKIKRGISYSCGKQTADSAFPLISAGIWYFPRFSEQLVFGPTGYSIASQINAISLPRSGDL